MDQSSGREPVAAWARSAGRTLLDLVALPLVVVFAAALLLLPQPERWRPRK